MEIEENGRAKKVINDATLLGVPEFIQAGDIVSANDKLNYLFCSEIYNANSGLPPYNEYNINERTAFAALISSQHKDDEDLKNKLPIGHEIHDLSNAADDGILLW